MDLRRLEVFLSVVKEGNFSRAARVLYLSQPTVSAHIENLEKELGTRLFERRSREAILTRAGEKFFPYACEIVRLKEAGLEDLSKFKEDISGSIKISASSTPGTYILPPLLYDFVQDYPGVSFEVSLNNTGETTKNVLTHKADLGFVGSVKDDKTLESCLICEDDMILITPMSYNQLPTTIDLQDIIDYPFVMRSRGSATRLVFEQELKEHNISLAELQVSITVDTMESLISCVSNGLGIGVLPSICVVGRDDLRQVKIRDMELKRNFHLIYHKSRVFSPAVEKALSFFTREALS